MLRHSGSDAPLPLAGTPTAALVPNSRLVVYENAPHRLYLTVRSASTATYWRSSKANSTLPPRLGASACSNARR